MLAELTPADVFVVAVSATDRDSNLNGKVSYRLLSSIKSGFYIDNENGKICVKFMLIMNSYSYSCVVGASHCNHPSTQSTLHAFHTQYQHESVLHVYQES